MRIKYLPIHLPYFFHHVDTKDAFASVFTDLTENLKRLLSRRMQASPKVYQFGCKEVCMRFLKVRDIHTADFGFKKPGSTYACALQLFFFYSFKTSLLYFYER